MSMEHVTMGPQKGRLENFSAMDSTARCFPFHDVTSRCHSEAMTSVMHVRWSLEKRHQTKAHTDVVTQVKYSPQLEHIFACSIDRSLSMLDGECKSVVRRFMGHRRAINALEFSQVYKVAITAGQDRQIIFWNPYAPQPMARLQVGPFVHCNYIGVPCFLSTKDLAPSLDLLSVHPMQFRSLRLLGLASHSTWGGFWEGMYSCSPDPWLSNMLWCLSTYCAVSLASHGT